MYFSPYLKISQNQRSREDQQHCPAFSNPPEGACDKGPDSVAWTNSHASPAVKYPESLRAWKTNLFYLSRRRKFRLYQSNTHQSGIHRPAIRKGKMKLVT